jgi:hypothetical protein
MDPMDPMDKYLVIAKYLSIGSIGSGVVKTRNITEYGGISRNMAE